MDIQLSAHIRRSGYVRVILHWRCAAKECDICYELAKRYVNLHASCTICTSCKSKLVKNDRCFKCLRFLTNEEYALIYGCARTPIIPLVLKECPRCGVTIEKIGGCDHMECQCGHHFDWLTGEMIDPDDFDVD